MNIVFFGSSSFVSQKLVENLSKKKNTIFFSRSKKYSITSNNFDLTSSKKIFSKLKIKKIDYLFFFSSYVPKNERKSKWGNCRDVNILGLVNFIKQIKIPIKKIILSSSCSVYGENRFKYYNENSIAYPESYYAISKFAQENIFRVFCEKNKIDFLCYRLGYVFGKNIYNKRLVKKIILNTKKKKIKIFNKKLNLNLIHTTQVSDFILSTYKKAKGIYNLTFKYKTSIKDFYNYTSKNIKNFKKNYNNYSPKKLLKLLPNKKYKSFYTYIDIFKNEI